MKGILLLAFICLMSSALIAQDSVLVWSENKQLQWTDFNGKAKDTTHFDAEVFAEIRYKYFFINERKYSFEVYAMVNTNTSWSKSHKQTPELLHHEQIHFDIAEVYARRLKEALSSYKYTRNYEQEIKNVFEALKIEYHSAQKKFDEETAHSLNKAKQLEWELYVTQELDLTKGRLKPLYAKIDN